MSMDDGYMVADRPTQDLQKSVTYPHGRVTHKNIN